MSGLAALTSLIVAYLAILSAGVWLSQPLRIRLANIIDELLAQPGITEREQATLDWLVNSSASSVVGLMLPIAALQSFATVLLGGAPKPKGDLARFWPDARFRRSIDLYVLSVAACSPFATLLAMPFGLASVMLQAALGEKHLRHAVEEPVLSASATFQPC